MVATARSAATSSSSMPMRSIRVPRVDRRSRSRASEGVPAAVAAGGGGASVMTDRLAPVTELQRRDTPTTGTDPRGTSTPRLLLVDGHSMAYRAFFALPVENFSTTSGEPTNAVYGFTSMLINVLRDEQPTHLAVAFDVSRKTFRSEIYADYKANRSESPTDFRGQVSLVQEVLAALHIPVITAENYEA